LAGEYIVRTDVADGVLITADITKIERVVYNLIINALNFTGLDKSITVRLYKTEKGGARFDVTDSGKGISKEQTPLYLGQVL